MAWLSGLDSNWANFAEELAGYAHTKLEFDINESQGIAQQYAERMQDLYDLYDDDEIDNDELTELFYDIYDELLDEYDIDLHDEDFYSEK